jgi:hypothetical protein
MSIQKINPRTIVLLVMIVVVGAIRTFFSMDENMFGFSNFSPVGAMALFGGAYFNQRWKAFLFPLGSLFLSDVVLQLTVFNKPGSGLLYGGWYYVYGAFILMVVVGRFIGKIKSENILFAALVVMFIHWVISDLGVWIGSSKYPQTFTGYLECLMAAIPFEWRFLAGTILYSAVLFGLFELLTKRFPDLTKTQTARV